MHSQVLWIPCVHVDIYYVCGMVVGMDVEFVKLVCVRHPLEADNSRRRVENLSIFTGVGRKGAGTRHLGGRKT